jgi:hypothetical protein
MTQLLLVVSIFFCSFNSNGQTTVSYTGMGTVTCPANPTATIAPAVTGLTFSQVSRGSSVGCTSVGSGNAGTGFNFATAALSFASNRYFSFTITSDAVTTFTISKFTMNTQTSNIATKGEVQYQIGAGALTTVGTVTHTLTSNTVTVLTPSTPISVGAGQTITIYLVGYAAPAGTTTFRFNNSTSVDVTTAGITPTLTATPTSLTFANQPVSTQSTSQQYALNGTNLSPANSSISVTAPSTDFQVSSDNSTWGPTASVAYTGTSMTNVPVYVRFTPQSAGAKSGSVTMSGGSVSSPPSVSVSGTGYIPATQLAVTTITPSTPTTNTSFSVTVEAQDATNTARAVQANTNVTISLASGTGSLTGTLTGTITAGNSSTTISGLLYNTAESGVSVTATRTSGDVLTAGTSSTFTVAAPSSATITVTSAFTPFTTVAGTPSGNQTYTVSGSNLVDDITITPPASFEISLNGTSWTANPGTIVLPQSSGAVATTTIFVRYNPAVSGTNTGTINHTSNTATSVTPSVTGTALALQPTVASAITFGAVSNNSMVVNFAGGNGTSRILIAYTSPVSFVPTDGVALAGVNANFGLATDQGSGNKAVYDGSGNTVTVTGLAASTLYYFAVYEYNGSGVLINYYTTAGTGSKSTVAAEPATATTVTLTRVKADQMVLAFAGGSGPNRMVVVRAGAAVSFTPADGTTYSGANSDFSAATDQGSGNKIVYSGATASALTVTGLSLSTTYNIVVYEFNGTSITTNYLTSSFGSLAVTTPSNISYVSGTYSQNFDGLPVSGTPGFSGFGQGPYYVSTTPVNATGAAGWQYANQAAADLRFAADNGTSTTGSAYSYGTTASTDRAIGSLGATISSNIGAVFVNDGTTPLSTVTITFNGEQWRYGGGTSLNTLSFEYAVNGTDILNGTFNAVGGLNYSSTVTSGAAAALNGNANQTAKSFTFPLATNWLPGQTLVIRWKDNNDPGADDGLAIDDFTFTAVGPQTPLVQETDFVFAPVLTNSLTASWTPGDGAARLVKMNTTNSFTDPVDGQTYTANSVYGGGEQIVYDGASNSVGVTNLLPNTVYYFRAYGYNGTGVATKYNVTTTATNPLSVTSAPVSNPTQLVVLNVNNGADVIFGQTFTITVQAQDNFGSPQDVTQNTTIDLSVLSGIGTLTGTVSAVMPISTNTLTITGIIYDTPESGVVLDLTASAGDPLTSTVTNPFNVLDVASSLQFDAVPPNGVNGQALSSFNVLAVRPDASIDTHYSGNADLAILSGPGTITGTVSVPFVNGIAQFTNVIFNGIGTYVLEATSGVLNSAISSNILINPPIAFTELVVPQYIGCKTTASTNTDRTPYAYCFKIDNLAPNTSYNVAAGIALTSEGATVLGAGSIWNNTAYSGQTKPGAFTTDANGSSGPVWIFIQPSGNATRFDAGQIHNMRIAYSTGAFGANITPNFVGSKTITALDITTSAKTPATTDDGAFMTTSFSACAGGKFILVYNNTAGTGDPLFVYQANPGTASQTTQTTLPASVDAIWQGTGASAGTFAAIIPITANNPAGVQRIEARDASNNITAFATSATGIWPGGANTTAVTRRSVTAFNSTDVNLSSVSVTASSTNVNCFGGLTGTATATATSTLTPITYLWSNSATTALISGVGAGTYSVVATDNAGCTASASTTITQPTDIVIVGQVTNTNCAGGNTGAIDITVSGGVSPYTYAWDNSSTSEDLTGLGTGTYVVTVTDGNGCTKQASFTIISQNNSSSVTATATPSTICAGGSSTLDASGASTYTWSPAGSLNPSTGAQVIATPTTTTTYSVVAIDGGGCQSIATVTVTVNAVPVTVASPATSAICEGSSVGLTATGATTYSWSPSTGLNTTTGATVTATPTTTTTYTVTGTSLGCSSTATATVNVTNVAAPTATSPVNYCQNAVAAPLSATATSGNSLWWYTTPTGGNASANAPTPSTATAGSTTYYVSQQATAPLSIAINGYLDNGAPDEYTFVALSRIPAGTVIYFTDNGWITGTGFRGATALDANGSEGFVRWTAVNTVAAGTVIKSAVSTADYTWTTSGPINCTTCTGTNNYTPLDFAGAGDQIYAFTSTTLDNPLFNVAQQIHLAVFDDTNGFETATSTATGAVPPGLTAGVEANTFAFASSNYVNLQNDGLTRTIAAWRTYIATPAKYTTGTGVNPGLPSTALNVDLGCESPRTPIVVNVNPAPVVTATPGTIACNGGTTSVVVSATGGTAPYTGEGTFTAGAGSQTYTVTDANSCSGSTTISITEPSAIVVTVTETTPIACFGGNGTVTVTATGGTGTLTGTGTFSANAGAHTYTVTDANNCTGTGSITLSEPSPIVVTVTETTPIACFGGNATVTVSATGGTGAYTGTGTFTVAAGTYSYTVTDANGCSGSNSITISQPAQVSISSFTPTSGCVGSTVTINGQNLNSVTSIDFNGISATFVIISSTEISATVPASATTGLINLTTSAGCQASSSSSFTVTNCNTGMTLNLKLFLQGFYLGGSTMNPALLYQGVVGATGAEADSIWIILNDENTFMPVDSQQVILMVDGTTSATFTGASAGNYYLSIRHRNSLFTWSSLTVAMGTSPASFDFTTSASQAFSGMLADDYFEGIYSIYSGDINQDEYIDASDYPFFDADNANGANSAYLTTDLNGDGFVDASDYPFFDGNNANGIFSIHP